MARTAKEGNHADVSEDTYSRHRETVHVDPHAVASVRETERRPAFAGWWRVAVTRMMDGGEFVVEDGARTAARRIREAKESATA